MSITQIAAKLEVHRSIAARLLVTLDRRGFVRREANGQYHLGMAVFTLARSVSQDVLVVANPLMVEAAARLNATIVFHLAEGDEAITMASIEPPSGTFRLGMRPGSRHPLDVAAHGVAILSGRPASEDDREDVQAARAIGYAVSVGEILPGFAGVSAPIIVAEGCDASVGCVVPRERIDELDELAKEIVALANRISLVWG
jgi:DNA-binding IclR family transcriptional regulator